MSREIDWSLGCAYCGEPTQRNHTIHRDGYGVGPEVPLCDEHGADETPTCEEIWARIVARAAVSS